ncbi:g9774 [Coccomyxa viridis]|uniref:G9774 protein n=1 Tax=Coccomyxa viridis TaxID=1274662 RepID=A0ABP1G806_9CHLO
MKGRTLGAAAVGFMLLGVCFLGSTKSPHTGGSSQGQERATRRTLIGRQEEVELLDSEVVQQETDGVSQEESFYMPWIKQDFAVWEEEGIKQSLVAEMAMRYRECFGEVFRFQIINGTLWVDHISERHGGWYPSQDGEGNLAAKGKIPYAILTLMDTLRNHPGQVADLDAIIQTSDFPCMLRLQPGTGALAPPIFGYNSHPKFVDIPFPDYSYWGHEYRRLLGWDGQPAHGWEKQFSFLTEKYQDLDLNDRKPQVIWRGRTEDREYPKRDELRRHFSRCADELRGQGLEEEADVFSLGKSVVQLHDLCDYRYLMYIEADAWATNLKQKLACGSVLMSAKMEYYEFFTRALQPNVHFVEVSTTDMCHDTASKVIAMNKAFAQEQKALSGMDTSSRHLLGQRQDVTAAPWNVAQAGHQFLAEHLRMRDVRMYVRDALSQYASLQIFTPQSSWNAECYTGEMLLEQFGFPYAADKDTVARAYPWLADYGKKECKGKLPRREVDKEEFYEA